MKNVILLCGILISFVCSASTDGIAPEAQSTGSAYSSGGGTTGDEQSVAELSESIECDDYGQYISYSQLNRAVPKNHRPAIKITYDNKSNRAYVQLNRHIEECLKVELQVIPRGGDYFVVAKNTYFDELKRSDRAMFDKLYAGKKGTREMYNACLENLKKTGVLENGKWTDKTAYKNITITPFNLELRKEEGKTISTNIYFGSYKTELGRGYEQVYKEEIKNIDGHQCFTPEKINEGDAQLYKNADQSEAHAFFTETLKGPVEGEKESDCPNCEYNSLMKAFESLRTGTGNAEALESWMRTEFIAQMGEKLNNMLDTKAVEINAELNLLDDKIKEADDREEAEEHVKRYMELVKDLDENYLKNRIEFLEDMYDCEADMTLDEPNRDSCTANIKKIKSDIKKFGTKHYLSDSVLRKIQKFGFSSEANEVKLFVLKSKYYGKYDGKDPKKPLKQIQKDLEAFEKKTDEYEKEYLARNEGEIYSDTYKQQIVKDQGRIESFNKQYSTFIEETQTACTQTMFGYANPTKCKRNQAKYSEVQALWQKKVGMLSSRIAKYGGVYEKYKGLEDSYVAENVDYDDEHSIWDDDVLYYERYDDDSSSSSSNSSSNLWQQQQSQYSMQQNYSPYTTQQNYSPYTTQQNYSPYTMQQNYSPYTMQQNYSPYTMQQNYSPYTTQQNYSPYNFNSTTYSPVGSTQTTTTPVTTPSSTGTYTLPSGF